MTSEQRPEAAETADRARTDEAPLRHDVEERRESGFAHLERAGAEAMAERPLALDEDGRAIVDPGQDMRAPEEQSSVHQALLDDEALRRGPNGRGAPL